ncbi:MAG TPA: SGNH/GDSL hydrolase family protein [Bacteroidales bacterium]|nr:SGNH/GDSL hydrolase family protein [Bacteroidales bacterium]
MLQTLSAQVKYYDASGFPLYGKITKDTETRYERLPASLKGKTREALWWLGTNTAGLYIRFRSDSKSVSARWELTSNNVMNHMAFVGIKGLDLYCLTNGQWRYVNSGRPTDKITSAKIIENMKGTMSEYMLYLPLYDGVSKLEIGVDSLSVITSPAVDLPKEQNPIVFYGTSITQGGCASRPGMAYTSILERKLNRQTINLGFSGNGQLDYEIADIMAAANASLYVLDFVPNVTKEQILTKMETFVKKLYDSHPQTPILIVESIIFPHSAFDENMANVVREKNAALNEVYKKMKAAGMKNLHYLSSEKLIGLDGEATVDGIHLTDLGFERFAEAIYPTIRKLAGN